MTCFRLLFRPWVMQTVLRATLRRCAKYLINASFAFPSAGGAYTRIFSAPLTTPAHSVLFAFGTTLGCSLTPGAKRQHQGKALPVAPPHPTPALRPEK